MTATVDRVATCPECGKRIKLIKGTDVLRSHYPAGPVTDLDAECPGGLTEAGVEP